MRDVPAALAPRPTAGGPRRAAAAVAMLVLVILAVVFFWFRPSDVEAPGGPPRPPESSPPSAAPAASPGASTAPAAPAPSAPSAPGRAAAPPASAAAMEISTTRDVWMRVTVDGLRTVERVVPGNTRIPIAAGGRIVIRAGDAGAVRVSIAGKDQGPLGRDGEVATRTFTPPAPPR